MSKQQPEFALQRQVAQYIRMQYKDVLFMSDTVASVKLTKPQAIRNKSIQKPHFKTPDLIIFEPKINYCGMFLELKVESPFLKDGITPKSEHISGQQKSINDLRKKGYYANFGVGFDDCKKQIDTYLLAKT
jgi:hypothetical protein